jgi:large subunit ribosomal protein L24
MKPTKIRNLKIYRASHNVLSKQLGSHLSKELRQKYGTRSIRVTTGDTVRVLRGEYKGVDGKVKDVNTLKNAVTIEGIKKEKLKGGQFDVYIHSSNLLVTEINTGDKRRVQKLEGKPKTPKEKEVKPKEQQEIKPKTEQQKEPPKSEPIPKQDPKAKPAAKVPKTKSVTKKTKKRFKEKG